MYTKITTAAIVAVGLLLAGLVAFVAKPEVAANVNTGTVALAKSVADDTTAQPTCCMKQAFCCTMNRPCCPGEAVANVNTGTVALAKSVADDTTAQPTCCMKQAYCCEMNRPCCQNAASVDVVR